MVVTDMTQRSGYVVNPAVKAQPKAHHLLSTFQCNVESRLIAGAMSQVGNHFATAGHLFTSSQ
jgi:hypothetical protein